MVDLYVARLVTAAFVFVTVFVTDAVAVLEIDSRHEILIFRADFLDPFGATGFGAVASIIDNDDSNDNCYAHKAFSSQAQAQLLWVKLATNRRVLPLADQSWYHHTHGNQTALLLPPLPTAQEQHKHENTTHASHHCGGTTFPNKCSSSAFR